MYLDYTPEQKALRDRLRAYFAELFTPELEQELQTTEGGGPEYHKVLQQMGADGWLGVGWPTEYGGQGRPAIEQFIFFDEVQRAGFPIPLLTLNTVGPTIMGYGTDAQKQRYLTRILAGKCHFSVGYTEPGAGTDLASLKTKAVRDGDEWVVNGQKIYTSLARTADHIWLAVRTDPDAPKHKGISIFIVDADSPGLSMSPIHTLGDNACCATYYEDVRVPAENLVGELNGGWRLITAQLNHERVALFAAGHTVRLHEEVVEWAQTTRDGAGQRVIERPWVQLNLARVEAKLRVLELMNWRQALAIEAGKLGPAAASAVKVYGSELYVEIYRSMLEVTGELGLLRRGSPGAMLAGRLERMYRSLLVLTFGGGTNEVQRDIIAQAGLRMPRSR